MECSHEARSIRGLLQQAPDGQWHATFRPATGLVLVKVSYCPWCGESLHGRPEAKPIDQPSSAHARRVKRAA